jgi:KUP system potassium uptake protein
MSSSSHGASAPDTTGGHAPHGSLPKLALAALGVVYGDIGTSPLYSVKECFGAEHGLTPNRENVLGILSLITWALTLVITNKYIAFILRADNRGEGGTFSLVALLMPRGTKPNRTTAALILLGLAGASLLSGEGVITPAISVLSAVEGLEVARLGFTPPVVPLTVAILLGLFLIQRKGTAGVGAVFGPATLLWFTTIAGFGVSWILRTPTVLEAANPLHALHFITEHKWHGFVILGSVVLCITGGEALYADMGHFGKRPIRTAWFAVVFPALLANYYGQGALLLARCGDTGSQLCRAATANPFYQMIPTGWMLYAMVAIATLATVVASQALISGSFSLAQQALQLGYSPRLTIVHTSKDSEGQIYVPEINYALMVACIALVLTFQQSSKLAAAYGIAVTGTMTITSILFFSIARTKWNWPLSKALPLLLLFLFVDVSFFLANVLKLLSGGWIPLAMGAVVFTLMLTWNRGRARLAIIMRSAMAPLDAFIADIPESKPTRVKGTAVFMTQNADGVPPVLLHHYKHNKVLHEKVILLSIRSENIPEVKLSERAEIEELGQGFYRVTAHYGFMQTPNVPEILRCLQARGMDVKIDDTSFYLGRETLLVTSKPGMMRWQKILFSLMSKNARTATAFFGLPPNRVVELGTQVEL